MATGKSEIHHAIRRAQVEWLQHVRRKTGLTFTEIARRAKQHPGTLNRFLNDEKRGATLAAQTVASVATATGVSVPADLVVPETLMPQRQAAAAEARGMGEAEAAPYQGGDGSRLERIISAMTDGAPHLVPWEMQSNVLELEHIVAGDIVILDLNATAKVGDRVCAQIYDWSTPSNTRTVFRVFEPPFLVYAGTDKGERKPRLVDGENVIIKGVVRDVLRRAPSPRA